MANERDSGELIRQLATSFGMADTYNSRIEGSRFDPATGTLYCDGIAVPKSSIESAEEFFAKQRDYYRSMAGKDSAAMEQFINFSVAYNAIVMMMAQKSDND
ncbi:hypothetical protein SAMN02910292_01174 [Lachnospiraceae bacterium XBB2008]|nr:hypothetical protein [Lachnospiraceae bacterium]SCY24127.1 hypothetical protein SAMN02910292_01174 [Lachnospiraceae bacterium XBB2008]